ncbi:MAG: H+-translocating [NiFe] hydrogenase complex, nickel insertion protein HypA [Candidatus Desulfovibrio kirbyi]|jgi:hydrogenase nickel incorporation protein HypA/HybF|uniref:Hydrogenase maturation factor HypA n=1 Tax=Candidatus Desulfovibrio kirbyi TaxID=2696086 RepID=A0A6L2R658_9BACT|nr:hydrogenase maturation nickel metallochaperone HypA [Desulfovibrio sp.]GFH62942.1 MAG: H+-translocating [NiFe] hydrogenase complex, nickel insertion protein HypA [Candidatus Desulfovibrio kirbyi]
MHEASLVQELLRIALGAVDTHNADNPANRAVRIQEIVCDIGLIASVEPQTLTGCFELFAEGTLAEGATLTLNTVPLDCECTACGHTFSLTQRSFVCRRCGAGELHFSGGHGLSLTSLRVEEEKDHARTHSGRTQ